MQRPEKYCTSPNRFCHTVSDNMSAHYAKRRQYVHKTVILLTTAYSKTHKPARCRVVLCINIRFFEDEIQRICKFYACRTFFLPAGDGFRVYPQQVRSVLLTRWKHGRNRLEVRRCPVSHIFGVPNGPKNAVLQLEKM